MQNTRLKGDTLLNARKLLNNILDYLESHDLEYHLEGGTLLGFVRDGEFMEWDHDIDISIPQHCADGFYRNRHKLWLKGYRVTKRSSTVNLGPIKTGDHRVFKVKRIVYSFFKMFSKRLQQNELVADIFVKFTDTKDVFWIAKESVMKAPAIHYKGFEELTYRDRSMRIPSLHREYLTHKYGDWSVYVKDWDCSRDEKSVISSLPA